jgi:hypothetical protein
MLDQRAMEDLKVSRSHRETTADLAVTAEPFWFMWANEEFVPARDERAPCLSAVGVPVIPGKSRRGHANCKRAAKSDPHLTLSSSTLRGREVHWPSGMAST